MTSKHVFLLAALLMANSCPRKADSVEIRYEITQIVDATGAGGINDLDNPAGLAVDHAGNVFVTGYVSANVLKITPNGNITEIIDASGDGQGHTLSAAHAIATDQLGNVYVGGAQSDNVFKIAPTGTITQILDPSANGVGTGMDQVGSIAVSPSSDILVSGVQSDNVIRISLGGIEQIIGRDQNLNSPFHVRTDAAGDAFVLGYGIIYRITPDGSVGWFVDIPIDVTDIPVEGVTDFQLDAAGNLYLSGSNTENVVRRSADGELTELIGAEGDGAGHALNDPYRMKVDDLGNVFVSGYGSDNVFEIASDGTITQIIDASGDGEGHVLDGPTELAIDNDGNVYVLGARSGNVFKLTPTIVDDEMPSNEPEVDDEPSVQEEMPEMPEIESPGGTGPASQSQADDPEVMSVEPSICGTGMTMMMPLLLMLFGVGKPRRSISKRPARA